MSKRYFGTDGIRGKVGIEPITADFMLKLGWAAGQVLATQREFTGVLIGKDTRISGYMFESALEAGLVAAGVDIKLLGPMPTPAIAYLTRTFRAHAGIVISASHNPYEDNGIKFFSSEGTKLPDAVETEIETVLKRPMVTNHSQQLGKAGRIVDAAGRYTEFCKSSVPVGMSLDGLHIVVDCAHGATYHIAPTVFRELGAKVSTIGVEPDGLNINAECGSTSPQALRAAVNATGADLGIAFDGDGDRVLFADRQGTLIDGDELLYVIARARQQAGMLKGPVVGTLMSNLGLERALKALNIPLLRAAVGDRYVMEELRRSGGILGGENSGHIICLDRTTTGDGIIAALQVLQVISESGQPIEQLIAPITKHPQHMINLACSDAQAALGSSRVQQAVTDLEAEMGERGRVLLRPSGTEPLVRVMVEGEDGQEVRRQCEQLAAAVTDALGCDDSGSSAAAQD